MRAIKENSTNNINRKAIEICPVSLTLDKIGGRWKPLILWHLMPGKKRYSELKKLIPSVTEKMLIQHLKQLEEDDLVIRKVIEIMPPHVEYNLSKLGKELIPVMNAMAAWGFKNRKKIKVKTEVQEMY